MRWRGWREGGERGSGKEEEGQRWRKGCAERGKEEEKVKNGQLMLMILMMLMMPLLLLMPGENKPGEQT
jgi:hypothetical protein